MVVQQSRRPLSPGPDGVATAAQLRAIAAIASRVGRGLVDITTRRQVQLRWIRIGGVPGILDQLLGVGLVTLQTGMDNIRNIIGCPAFGLTPNELLDVSQPIRAFTAMFVGSKTHTNPTAAPRRWRRPRSARSATSPAAPRI